MDKLLVFVEVKGDEPRKATLELLSETRKLSEAGSYAVTAVGLGKISERAVEKVLAYADRFVRITDPLLDDYTPEGYSEALAAYARQEDVRLVLGAATQTARDFLPRTAVLLKAGIASDVTAIGWTDNPMTFVRPMYGGRVPTRCTFTGYPAVVSVRPNSFAVAPAGERRGAYVEVAGKISPDRIKTRVLRVEVESKGKVDLMEADIIVTGGRGMKAAENFALLEDLAAGLGAAVGASRSVVDAKWRDQDDQVGKSGKTVSPKLYIAAGLSGAIHHVMGMDTSGVILAINKDPNAIIFNYANYGIVGDVMEIVPAMTAELKKRTGQ
jgi:electron transfer flavoprotein alpha subunit